MYKINVSEVDRLLKAVKEFSGDAEQTINDVLHAEATGAMVQESIKRLMPVSGAKWRGKKGAAKTSNSLRNVPGNLSLTVTTTKNYQYLYFPDDGSNTRRHIGNQQFFQKGGEAVENEVIDRVVGALIEKLN